jgi:hypothetical protein
VVLALNPNFELAPNNEASIMLILFIASDMFPVNTPLLTDGSKELFSSLAEVIV